MSHYRLKQNIRVRVSVKNIKIKPLVSVLTYGRVSLSYILWFDVVNAVWRSSPQVATYVDKVTRCGLILLCHGCGMFVHTLSHEVTRPKIGP